MNRFIFALGLWLALPLSVAAQTTVLPIPPMSNMGVVVVPSSAVNGAGTSSVALKSSAFCVDATTQDSYMAEVAANDLGFYTGGTSCAGGTVRLDLTSTRALFSVPLNIGSTDVWLYRSAAKTLTIDTDGAGGGLTAVNFAASVLPSANATYNLGSASFRWSGINAVSISASSGATAGTFGLTNTFASSTAPTISSGFGSSPSIASNNGTAAFTINVGTGGVATSGVIGLPTATTGWRVSCDDVTTQSSTVYLTKQTATSTTTATIGNFDAAGAAAAWVASNILVCSAMAY